VTTADVTPVGDPATARWIDNETAGLSRSWHVVAASDEVDETPRQIWLLGLPWVLARTSGGLVAFVDRCPHRLAPLSAGTVVGDRIKCRYHGWEFRADGTCESIPSNAPGSPIPARACATRPFAVQDRFGLVWLAPDAPVCSLHDFPEWDDPAYDRARNAPRRTSAGAGQLADNFLDASHFPTVHTKTFGTPEAAYVSPHTVGRDGWEIRTVYEAPYRNHDDPLVATGEHPLVQPHILTKVGRPSSTVYLTLDFPLTGVRLAILFACQPERHGSTRVYKLMAHNGYDGDQGRIDELIRFEDVVLDEDLDILERYPSQRLATDLGVEVHSRADRLSVAYRRLLADLLQEGNGQ
jgi:phenylpropionate dioxygenase-like ring-hydroxylating dioxygenase large terminal subunit